MAMFCFCFSREYNYNKLLLCCRFTRKGGPTTHNTAYTTALVVIAVLFPKFSKEDE
jgi:hypothetical protein